MDGKLKEGSDSSSHFPLSPSLQKKLSQAKAKLLVEQPYFGTLASRLELKPNDEIESFLSDGTQLDYNDQYLNSLELDEIGFVLSNGAMHAALAHDLRQKGRMGWLWQLATDYAINAMLVENGQSTPERINYDPRFDGLYAEEIYATLKDEIRNEEFNSDESNETGFNEENRRHQNEISNPDQQEAKDQNRPQMEVENDYRPQSSAATEEAFDQLMQEMLDKFSQELPDGLERFIEIPEAGVIDWRSELHHVLDRHYRSNYRTLPPSKKLLYMGTYLPSLYSEKLRLSIAIDSSGSVDETLLGSFMAEVESLMLTFPDFEIELIVCDAKIHSVDRFVSGDKLDCTLKGGGATDFRPVFEHLAEEDTQLLLYFTDTQGRFPDKEPFYEVIWITPSSADTPFGKQLIIS
ncbi:MAG: VWA-like domain-containing protein [Campylobacterota bacterium]|nr:VWA-like domain-containing protein [Campylobacterota bacterium]